MPRKSSFYTPTLRANLQRWGIPTSACSGFGRNRNIHRGDLPPSAQGTQRGPLSPTLRRSRAPCLTWCLQGVEKERRVQEAKDDGGASWLRPGDLFRRWRPSRASSATTSNSRAKQLMPRRCRTATCCLPNGFAGIVWACRTALSHAPPPTSRLLIGSCYSDSPKPLYLWREEIW